jgi:tetratricopeptide (TPR) repeat protein
LLKVWKDELLGDIGSRDTRESSDAKEAYQSALRALDGLQGIDLDISVIRARLYRKLANLRLFINDLGRGQYFIDQAHALLERYSSQPQGIRELAQLFHSRAELSIRQGLVGDAKAHFSKSIVLFQQALDAGIHDNQILLEFAQALQNYGDIERQSGDGDALTTYNKAMGFFNQVLADDPSSAGGRFGLDFVRHIIRLLGLTDKQDSIIARQKAEIDNALDENFAMGIGHFRFGMTPEEVTRLLHVPVSTSTLPPDISQGDIFEEHNYFLDTT